MGFLVKFNDFDSQKRTRGTRCVGILLVETGGYSQHENILDKGRTEALRDTRRSLVVSLSQLSDVPVGPPEFAEGAG